jgi:farnesyl diphosphate synthase
MREFQTRLMTCAAEVEKALSAYLCEGLRPGEIARPERLWAAMRHAVLNGGKRLRPFLVLETASLFETGQELAMPAACAIECVHSYSLVHDDLPAMDDDDLRRGQPTVHRAFDEATAILAGDGLLTLAFDILADPSAHFDPEVRVTLVLALARAAGAGGMVGGQMLDLQAETRMPDRFGVERLQMMKTGALLSGACEMGAILGGATAADRKAILSYGQAIGQAFQLADDILDVTASEAEMGKRTGKDAGAGKGTLVDLLGLEAAQEQAKDHMRQACDAISCFGDRATVLQDCARFIIERKA